MGVIKKSTLSLIIAVVLSLILHIVVIAGISGIDLFSFKELFAAKPFHAKIVSESPKKPNLSKLIKEPPPVQPDNIPQKQETPPATEEDVNRTEQPSEVLPVDKQAQDNKDEFQQTASLPASEKPIELPKTQDTVQILKSAREKLYFDIYWLGIYVGKAVLEAVNDNGNVKITSQVHSAPLISAFYKVEDYAESHITNGTPSFFKIKQREGRKRGNKETFFDITNKKVTHINHIKGTKDEHTISAENLWDVMSGFYYLRTQKLNVGETVYINVFDSNKFYKAEVEVLRKDKVVMSDEKELDAVVVKPRLKSEGLFENKGDISVWLSDDDMKIPLKVETEVPIGKVTAELKSLETEK
ncbi:MAG: DUF3108 domain-containing protein [Nitrospirota bacterium]